MPRDTHIETRTHRPTASHLAYASERRAEFFSLLNSLSLVRRHGPKPFDHKLREMTEANLKARTAMAAKVLP